MAKVKILTGIICIGLTASAALGQGSLTPPGAPAATMKTLQQVEPRTDVATLPGDTDNMIVITNSGSYYLSANLEVTKTYGIQIDAVGVTLDLNGFEILRFGRGHGLGIYVSHGSTVKDCTVSFNQADGIWTESEALVTGNICADNGGAGIHCTDRQNRIDGNTVSDNGKGIHVGGAYNLIIRNSALVNGTNYEIQQYNIVGDIVLSPWSAAISGSTGGAGVGSTNPWANISMEFYP